MRWPVILACAVAIACGNKHRDEPEPPATPPGLVSQSTVAASCERLAPKAVIEKHLAGFAFDAMGSSGLDVSPGPGMLCVFRKPGSQDADLETVMISFAPGDADQNTKRLDAMVKNGGAHEVTGIGRRAVSVANTIEFWSSLTSCVVSLPANEQLAKDLDATLTLDACPNPR